MCSEEMEKFGNKPKLGETNDNGRYLFHPLERFGNNIAAPDSLTKAQDRDQNQQETPQSVFPLLHWVHLISIRNRLARAARVSTMQ